MNQNEIHLSKHLWSIAVKLGGIYMELTIPFSVRNDIGNIYRSAFYKIYTPPLVVLSKRSKSNLPSTSNIPSSLSQVPFLPSLSFLVHFVDKNTGHYITDPNHALFFLGNPYLSIRLYCFIHPNFGNFHDPPGNQEPIVFIYCFPFARAPSSPWPHTGTHLCLCHACLQLLQLFCTHLSRNQRWLGHLSIEVKLDISKYTWGSQTILKTGGTRDITNHFLSYKFSWLRIVRAYIIHHIPYTCIYIYIPLDPQTWVKLRHHDVWDIMMYWNTIWWCISRSYTIFHIHKSNCTSISIHHHFIQSQRPNITESWM